MTAGRRPTQQRAARHAVRQDFSRAKKQQLSPAFLLLVEIWLGAHTPHILRLAGEKADGWLPSQNYIA